MKLQRSIRRLAKLHTHALWTLPAFGTLLVAGVWAATWLQLQSTEGALIAAKIRDTEAFVASFERYTLRQIKDADRMARIVKREFELHGDRDLARLVQAGLIEDNPEVVVSVVDAEGDLVASSQPFAPVNIADREYFRLHQASDSGLLDISAPIISRVSGRQIIQLSRRMNGAKGSFAGVVLLSVTPAYFTDFSKQADPRKQGSLGLLGLDGRFRARVLDGEPTEAEGERGAQLVARAAASPAGVYESRRSADDAVRIVAYRKLADYPFIVTAAKATDEALDAFYQNRSKYLAVAATATAAIVIFFAVVTLLMARLQRHRRELEVQRGFLETLVDNVPSGISVSSMKPGAVGQYVLWSESNAIIFGKQREEVLGKTIGDVTTAEYAGEIVALDRQLLASPMVQEITHEREVEGKGRRAYHLIRAPIFGAGGEVDYIMTTTTDITGERARTDELRLASKVFETTADGIVVSDAGDRIVVVNAAFSKLTGYDAQEIVGTVLAESPFRPIDLVESDARMAQLHRDGFVTGEVARFRKDGTPLSLWVTASCVRNEDGTIRNYVRVFTDISLLKNTQRELEQLASFDAMTGLPNRRLLLDRLEQAIRRAQRSDGIMAVMFVDLDGLKKVNDTLGHDVGDLLLQEVALRLQKCVRPSDSVGRLGGDEFAIVLEDARSSADAAHAADRILAAIASPYELGGRRVATTASIGIAVYSIDGRAAADLLKHSDVAMYRAKQAGRNQFRFFSEARVVEAAIF